MKTIAYYYTRDHQGSVREMCTVYGTVEAQMTYDLYGKQPGGIPPSPFQPSMRYAGYYLFGGLYLTRAGLGGSTGRPYDPNTGTWLSRDPAGEGGGINLYGYVSNDPMLYIDSLGLDCCTPNKIAAGEAELIKRYQAGVAAITSLGLTPVDPLILEQVAKIHRAI